MVIQPVLDCITIYPVKSLDGILLEKAMVCEGGCLLHDREYAMLDSRGRLVTGKSNERVHQLRSRIDLGCEIISFRRQQEESWIPFHLQKDKRAIESYLGDHFGMPIYFHQDSRGRFLDIPDTSGATILSTSSLETVAGWYDHLNLTDTRRRFRATLEIEGVPAFWEDHLFSGEGSYLEFRIGEVTFWGMGPRARCVVPTRNPETGEVIHAFPKTFARNRSTSLPGWSKLHDYGHHYYLSVDCLIPATEVGKFIKRGDKISIVGERRL